MFISNYNALDVLFINWFIFFIYEMTHHNGQVLEEELNGQTAIIGIKRMGELDEKPFYNACKRKYGKDDYLTKAAELVSSWQEELKKPSWHPFKVVQDNGEDKVFTVLFYSTIGFSLERH